MNINASKDAPRIAIIGAGPAGLYAAEALREAGIGDVTIFEKQARVGGMALSRVYECQSGKQIVYEVGSAQPFGSKRLFRLIKELGLHLGVDLGEDYKVGPAGRFRFYSVRRQDYVADFYKHHLNGQPLRRQVSLMRDVFRFVPWLWRYRKLVKPGYAHSFPTDLAGLSEDDWIRKQDFRVMAPLLKTLFSATVSGCMHDKASDPRSMLHSMKNFLYGLKPPLRYTVGLFQPVREGYQEILNRLAKRHRIVTQATITSIKRSARDVTIRVNDTTQVFDYVIVACPPKNLFDVMDMSPAEVALFERIRNYPTWRACFLARGIPDPRSAYVYSDQAEFPDAPPGPSALSCHGLVSGTGVDALRLYCCMLGHDKVNGIDEVLKYSANLMRDTFGAYDVTWIDKVFWPQFNSHFSLPDIKEGVYEQLEAMQGGNRTFYTGEYASGNSHAMVMDYGHELATRVIAQIQLGKVDPAANSGGRLNVINELDWQRPTSASGTPNVVRR